MEYYPLVRFLTSCNLSRIPTPLGLFIPSLVVCQDSSGVSTLPSGGQHFLQSSVSHLWKLLTPCSSCLGVKFCMYVCACVQLLQSCLSLQPYRLAHQAPLTADFSRQEYWSGLLCPPPGDLPHPGIEPASSMSPALQLDSFTTEPLGKPSKSYMLSSKSEFLLF